MDVEKLLMDGLEWLADEHADTFVDVRLRDWRESFSKATVWVRLGKPFGQSYAATLKSGVPSLGGEEERDTATRLAVNPFLKKSWFLERAIAEPLDDENKPLETTPRDALLYLWLKKPSADDLQRAAKLEGQVPGMKTSVQAKHIGGRPGYVVRAADFYDSVWGLWIPNPKHSALMAYVAGIQTYSFESPAQFASTLNKLRAHDSGFDSAEGNPFTARSVRRLNIARELLLGNEQPND